MPRIHQSNDLASPSDPSTDDRTITCRPTERPSEVEACRELRKAVFVDEQAIFAGSDEDARDHDSATVHIVGLIGSRIEGTVRIYPLSQPGMWQGDRLAVSPALRNSGAELGGRLVRCAVHTAGRMGGSEMIAQIQLDNVRFFTHLGWSPLGEPGGYQGVLHQKMRIGLLPPRDLLR